MTKEKCTKKVVSGEHAVSSYDHPVWDTVGIKHRRVIFKLLLQGLTILDEFSTDLNLLYELLWLIYTAFWLQASLYHANLYSHKIDILN